VAIWLAALSFVVGAHEPGADRHAYVLVAALAVALAALAARATARTQRLLAVAALAFAASLAMRTHQRIAIWHDDLSLWSSALGTSSSSARVQHNMAAALAERGRFARAHRHLGRAIAIDSSYWPSWLGFAGIDCERKRFAAARMRIDEARALGATPEQIAAVERRCAVMRTSR
jgi:tetratricopeptide (TPR) repeat protein